MYCPTHRLVACVTGTHASTGALCEELWQHGVVTVRSRTEALHLAAARVTVYMVEIDSTGQLAEYAVVSRMSPEYAADRFAGNPVTGKRMSLETSMIPLPTHPINGRTTVDIATLATRIWNIIGRKPVTV